MKLISNVTIAINSIILKWLSNSYILWKSFFFPGYTSIHRSGMCLSIIIKWQLSNLLVPVYVFLQLLPAFFVKFTCVITDPKIFFHCHIEHVPRIYLRVPNSNGNVPGLFPLHTLSGRIGKVGASRILVTVHIKWVMKIIEQTEITKLYL